MAGGDCFQSRLEVSEGLDAVDLGASDQRCDAGPGLTALFAGNEIGAENWAMLASLVATCKLSGVNQVNYLADTLQAILDGHPESHIEDLKPWR